MFSRTSRYQSVPDAVYVDSRGREVPYKRLRLVPATRTQRVYVVAQGDRLDRIAAQLYGDPEQFYRIADANVALRPEALTEDVGRRLDITLV